ncbi:vesicle transport v-snare protein vti1 [Dacryopinax primogenitus]|uniref:Vesicle transport v-snare protein vti1 n=1 Tax=Dacryopinax primogenitus (strain DJM 731) TaxID=1858805 RepID=M5G9K2_DACPD|nr:vesicle transport v-snare protein vti1 [Dacryopinax primogenitus]EJU02542.1 vesicle transport v-snare protein vti1 [Dacryopinax primogenitus]
MDNTPTALFESYERDFNDITGSIKNKLEESSGEAGVASNIESRKAALRRVEMELDEGDEMVSQMEVEIQGMPQSIRSKYVTRLKAGKTELAKLKKQAKDLSTQTMRAQLIPASLSGAPSDDPYGSNDQRTRLLSGTERLADGQQRLEESRRIALETEDVGADILRNLRGQREQIEHARDTLHTADRSIDKAASTLRTMIRRMYQQRFTIAAIIAVLIILIILILYFKLR